MRKPEFSPLDLRTWKRGQMFYYFAKMAPTGYSLTVDVDITRMLAVCREAGALGPRPMLSLILQFLEH